MSYLDSIHVKLIETRPKNILFVREKMNIKDYGEYLGKLYKTVMEEKFTTTGVPISIYHDEEFDVEIAIPVKEVTEKTRELSGGLCAMVSHRGYFSEISSVYTKLKEWTEKEGYKILDAPYEVCLTDPTHTLPKNNVTEIYFPVKK